MKEFIKNHKKEVKIGLIVFIVILILLILWLFIFPSFSNNKYGDRLKDKNKHKITNEVISKIKDKAKENESVIKVDYHDEGRILNFIVTVDSNLGLDQAKEVANNMLKEIDGDDQKYYDIQFLIDSSEKSDNYPIIGYKNKGSDNINFGNAGGK